MKVILNQTVPKVGKQGQVVNVADGFARNFLFPQSLARVADKNSLADLERRQQKETADIEKTRDNASKTAEKLNGAVLKLTGSTARGADKLFGAITSQDIADALKQETGVEVDRRQIALLHPIKRLGIYQVLVDLHRDVDATVRVEVANEEGYLGAEEAAKQAAAAAAKTGDEAETEDSAAEPTSEEAPAPELAPAE